MDAESLPATIVPGAPFLRAVAAFPVMPPDYVQPGMTAHQFAVIVWARRRASLLIAGSVLLVATVGCLLWPRTYEAVATLMVNFEVNDPLAGREFPIGLLGSYMATQVELARGIQVMRPVVDRLHLVDIPEYAGGFAGARDDAVGLRDWTASRVQRHVTVEQGRYGSQLLTVSFSATSPTVAAAGANAVAEVYAEQQHLRLTGPANERARRYTEQLGELKDKVVRAQEQVTALRQSSGLVDSESKFDVEILQLSALQQRLLEAQTVRRVAEARSASDPTVGAAVLNSSMIQSLKTQLASIDTRLAQLGATLGPRHPEVLELQSQRLAARRALDSELGAYAGNAGAELASARQLEAKLESALAEQRSRVLGVRDVQDRGAKAQLELASAQAVYKRALDGNDQMLFASAGAYRNVDFVSRATPPTSASRPRVAVALLLACIIGGALGLALPFGYELLHRRIRCRDDLERDLGIPVLIDWGDPRLPASPRPAGAE